MIKYDCVAYVAQISEKIIHLYATLSNSSFTSTLFLT